MTDIFSQENIDFQSSGMASTSPSAAPTPIKTPKVNIPSNTAPDTAVDTLTKGSPVADKDAAVTELFGSDAPKEGFTQHLLAGGGPQMAAAEPAPAPKDIFAAEGIEAPTATEANVSAFDNGAALPPTGFSDPEAAHNLNAAAQTAEGDKISSAKPMSRSAMSMPPGLQEPQHEVEAYAGMDMETVMKLAESRYTPEQIAEWQNSPITFGEAFKKLHPNQVLPGGGFSQLYNSLDLVDIAKKAQAGEQLTPEDQKKMNEYLDEQLEQRIRGFSWGGNVAYIGSQIPAFVVEFALSDGVGKTAQIAAVKGAEKVAASAVLQKTAGIAARVATTTSLMPAQVAAKYGERRLNDIAAVTDKGELVLKKSEESPASSALLAFAHTSSDAAAQIAAPGIGKYLVNPVTRRVTTPLIAAVNQLPAATKLALYGAYKTMQPSAQISKVFTAAGWAGMIEQLGANRVADILHATLDYASEEKLTTDQYLDRLVPSKDQLMVEGGLISIAGSIHTGSSVAFNLMRAKGLSPKEATETVNNMTAIERESYVNDNLVMPKSDFVPNDPVATRRRQMVIDNYQTRLNAVNNDIRDIGQRAPLQSWIKELGGVKPGSVLAGELKHIGLTSKTSVGLFRKNGTAGDLDNIPATEFNDRFGVHVQEDGNGYVDRNWLLEQIRNETFGKRIGQERSTHDDGFLQALDEVGLDPRTATAEQVYHALGADPEISREAASQGETITDADAEDIRGMMQQDPNLSIEDAVAHWAEREGIRQYGESADGVPTRPPASFEADVVKSQIDSKQASEPPPIHDHESVFNNLYRAMVNEQQPIHDLEKLAKAKGIELSPMENPKFLSSVYSQNVEIIRENLQVQTSTWGPDGNRVATGKALKGTLDDFDNYFIAKEPARDARHQDFNDFLVSERFLEVLKEDKGDYKRVSKEQETASVTTLARLADKYGDDFHMISALAKEVYDFQDRIVQNLVDSGVMSKELYDTLKTKYTKYVPLQRVIEDKGISDAVLKGPFTDARKETVIKRLRGSDKEVQDVFHSIISNTAKILDLAARNKVAQTVADLGVHLPEYIQREKTPIVKKGTAEVAVSYDPKLREKLEKTIEFLGGRLERNKSVKVKGFKGVLGSYSAGEKLVRLKIGSTEGTMSHEVGHMLDHELGLKSKMLKQEGVRAELQKLAKDRLSSEQELVNDGDAVRFKEKHAEYTPQKYLRYITNDREVLANFFDAYVNSPEQLKKTAPKALAAFEKILDENPQLEFLREVKPSTSRQEEMIEKDVYGEADYAPPKTITVFRNGKREYYRVAQPLLEAMAKLGPAKMNLAEKILAAPFRVTAHILRTGATLTPEFAIRNILRDQQDAFLQSGVRYTPDHFVRGLFSSISENSLYHQWAAAGGKFSSYMSLDDKGIQKAYKELFNPTGKLMRYLKNPVALPADIAQAGEHATRVGVFSAAKQAGKSDIEAAYASLEATLNFARRGSVGGKINQYIPFFNAGIQGIDKLARTFKSNPKALSFWAIATITVPSLTLTGYYLYGAPEQDRKEFLEIPQWQRDMFWVVKVDGEWLRYPKPFSYGYIFGSIPERIMQWMYDGDKPEGENAWLGIVKGLAGSVSPVNDWSSVLPPLLKTTIEDTTNYNFFSGRNIYPDWMERLEPEQRSNKYTTETAKGIGSALHVSPALVENTAQGLAGGSGKYALQAGDQILKQVKAWNGEATPEKPTVAADIPLIKAFYMRQPSGYNSNSAANFFKNFEEVSQKRNTSKKLEGEEKAHYIEANQQYIARYGFMNSAYKQIRAQQKQIDAIYDNPSMDGKDKVLYINRHAEAITRIAQEANKQYNLARKAGQ